MSETTNLKLFKHDEVLEENETQFDLRKALHENLDKIDDFAGEVNEFNINTSNDIQNLEKENKLLREDINNASLTGQVEGENITIEDSAKARFPELKVKGNSWQETDDTMPSPEYPSEIKNCKNEVNFTICNKNLLSNKFEDYDIASGSYGFTKIVNNFTKKYLIITVTDKDTSVDISNIYFGLTGNGVNADEGIGWIASNGTLVGTVLDNKRYLATDKLKYFSFYPKTEATFNKIFSRFNIEVELSDTSLPTDYIEHQSQRFTFPLSEGQRLYKDSYLADDGIHHKRGKLVLDGTEIFTNRTVLTNTTRIGISITPNAKSGGNQKCTHFKHLVNYTSDIDHFYAGTTTLWLFVPIANIGSGENQIKQWLAEQYANGTPITVEYELAEEIIEPYTEEQQKVYNEINKTAHSYKGVTHIFCTDEISCEFETTYIKDLETIINNLNTAIVALGGV